LVKLRAFARIIGRPLGSRKTLREILFAAFVLIVRAVKNLSKTTSTNGLLYGIIQAIIRDQF
jgi:hypothetical protein